MFCGNGQHNNRHEKCKTLKGSCVSTTEQTKQMKHFFYLAVEKFDSRSTSKNSQQGIKVAATS